jgi:hypothetical protein
MHAFTFLIRFLLFFKKQFGVTLTFPLLSQSIEAKPHYVHQHLAMGFLPA